MKDKRQRQQSIFWPINMAPMMAAAAAAATDQSGLYAYIMQSLLHAQYPYPCPVLPAPPSLSLQSSSGLAAAVSSPLSYLAAATAARPVTTPFPLPIGSCSDRVSQFPVTWESLDYDQSLMWLAAARQRAVLAAGSMTGIDTTSTASSPSISDSSMSTSLFRPYQSLSVGGASD